MWGLFHKLVINSFRLAIVSSWEQSIKRNMREILDPSHPLKFRDVNLSSDFFFFPWVLSNVGKMLNLILVPQCPCGMARVWNSPFFTLKRVFSIKKSHWVFCRGNEKLPKMEGVTVSGSVPWTTILHVSPYLSSIYSSYPHYQVDNIYFFLSFLTI